MDEGFASPAEAVDRIAAMLRAGDWAGLARCADLEGTGVGRAELESGAWFQSPPDGPFRASGARRPFPPGYTYLFHEESGDEAVVTVGCLMDQGDGTGLQGLAQFRLRKSAAGWRFRPGAA